MSALRQQVLPVSFILRCESCLARVRPDPIWSALPPPPAQVAYLPAYNLECPDQGQRPQASKRASDAAFSYEKKSNDKSYVAAVYDVALNSGL